MLLESSSASPGWLWERHCMHYIRSTAERMEVGGRDLTHTARRRENGRFSWGLSPVEPRG